MINSRNKGKVGERELAKILSEMFGVECRRGQQYSGVEGRDVIGLPGVHIECKRVERLNIMNAIEQAKRDAAFDHVPAVFHRSDRKPWLVTVALDDLLAFVVKCAAAKAKGDLQAFEEGGK